MQSCNKTNMVRKAQRKTNRGIIPKDVMKRAAQEVLELRRGNRATAEKYGICHVTLYRYCKKVSQGDLSPSYGYRSHTKVFTSAEEEGLVQYLKRSADIYFGLPPSEVRKFAYEFAVSNNKEVPPSWKKNKSAGPDWFTGFMKRNPTISIRTPEATSLQRAMNFNRVNVGKFFDKLMQVMDRHSLPPHRIWNTDETGVTTVHKPNKIVGCKGKKQIGAITSAERGQLVTVCTKKLARKRSTPPPVPRTVTEATVVAVKESVDSSTPNLFTCDQSSKSGARRKENSCGQSTLASKKNREFREQ